MTNTTPNRDERAALYIAFLAAADHIEQNPELFDFMETTVPECGTPGCALGWVGAFMGIAPGEPICDLYLGALERQTGMDDLEFYDEISQLTADMRFAFTHDAAICAAGMRRFAEKHLS